MWYTVNIVDNRMMMPLSIVLNVALLCRQENQQEKYENSEDPENQRMMNALDFQMVKTFSVNFPNADLVMKTDYCGIRSGKRFDKSKLFDVFYGNLNAAPMIKECPVTAECELYDLIDVSSHYIVLGEVKHIYS